ncbi:MAG: hypothetical protein ACYCVH_03525 [Ignavibacteriaceae bacterium]
MKVCEILEEFEFLPVKEKQKFLLKAWSNFRSEISDEDFVKEFMMLICNDKMNENNTRLLSEDIINKMKEAKKL